MFDDCAGIGHIVETLESSDYSVDTVEGVEARSRILLSWGAQLFSAETFKVRKVFENIEALSYQTTNANSSGSSSGSGAGNNATTAISTELLLQLEEWNQSAAAKMTSMVSVDCIKCFHLVHTTPYEHFSDTLIGH